MEQLTPNTSSAQAGWIESPKYDLWLIILPSLFGLMVCSFAGLVDPYLIAGTSLFLLGMPHYLSTYCFYFDDKNMAYAKTRKFAFFAGPVIIVMILTASLALKLYLLVALWVDAWNVFHVSRQSAGILSVYRHLNGGDNRVEKWPANIALVGIAGGLYSVTIQKQPSFVHYLGKLPFPVMPWIAPVLLTAGVIALGVLVLRMVRRGVSILSPEMVFLFTSILLFSPYVILNSRSTASSAMLSGHYVQYMGVLWLLNHRKYRVEDGSKAQRMLAFVSMSVTRIVLLLGIMVAATGVADRYVHHINAQAFHTWILNIVVLMHFYLDGLFWAFKHRHTRESLGPYLLLPSHRVNPAPVAIPAPVAAT